MVAAVAFLYIPQNFIPTFIAEVDIYIGHTHALGVEKALKVQPETYRVDISNTGKVCRKTSRPRSPAGTDRDPVLLGESDIIGHYEKIIGVSHAADDRKLVIEPYFIFIGSVVAVRDPSGCPETFKPARGKTSQSLIRRNAARRVKGREQCLTERKFKIAAFGNLHRIFKRALIGAEKRAHFIGRFVVKFIRFKTGGSAVSHSASRLYAHKDSLSRGIRAFDIMYIVRSDHAEPALARQLCKRREYLPLLGYTVILKLDEKVVLAEYAAVFFSRLDSSVIVARNKTRGYLPGKARRKRDKPFVIFCKQLIIHTRS